jgi:hypothetical protein
VITALVIAFINCNPPPPSPSGEGLLNIRDGLREMEAEASKADITLDDTIYTR